MFLWGSNKHGQLTSSSTDSFLPRPVLLDRSPLGGEKVTHVHSGWTHLVAQTGERERHEDLFLVGRKCFEMGRDYLNVSNEK